MIDNEITLLDRLNEIVDEVHIDEVKKIIATLSKISRLKYSLEENLSENILYEKVSHELENEFDITNLKIVHTLNNVESILYQCGDENFEYTYLFKNRVSSNININIYLDVQHLDEYRVLSLNTYFKELVHLLYIQFVLLDVKKSSTIDPLTQLQNRISFNTEMKTLVPLAIRENMKFGVLLINIDRFRAVNDEHGDEFGDEFLRLYADVIKNSIRTSDIAVRFAGGEFLVLLINVESEEMTLKIAEKIKDKLAQTYLLSPNNDKFKKTVCIGVSMFPEDSQDINEVIKFSEMALSDARDKGRNNIVRYTNSSLGEIDFF
ncbi:MAG: GGDEF domain-containing protein [Arcobacteraceae bacterium]